MCTTAAVGALMFRYLGFSFEEYYIYFSFDLSLPAQIRKKTESAGLSERTFNKIVSVNDVVIGTQMGEYFGSHSRKGTDDWVKTTRYDLKQEDAHKIVERSLVFLNGNFQMKPGRIGLLKKPIISLIAA